MDCLHCGKKLSMVKKLTTGEFCSAAHKKAYLQEQEKFALARLLENQDRLGGKAAPVEKKDLDQVARDATQARAAKRGLRGKPKAEAMNAPVEGDYLLEPVRPMLGPKYLALPESNAQMDIAPVLPEFGGKIEAASTAAITAAGSESVAGEPFVSVSSRFGLEAIFGGVPQEDATADLLGMAEFAAHRGPEALWASGSGQATEFAPRWEGPPEASRIQADWLETPARRASQEWERAIDAVAAGELDPTTGFDLRAHCRVAMPGDGTQLEAYGPKRFAFSRMPELASSFAGSGVWGLAAAVAMPGGEPLLLAEELTGFGEPMPLAGGEVALMPGNGKLEWKRQGSIHEVAAAKNWAGPVSSRDAKQTELRGAVGQMGSEYGYLGLPQGCGAGLAEATVQYWGEESGAVYEARTLAARQPRGPYDLSLGNRYFPPPPRIASVPRAESPMAHPRLETRLVAVPIPSPTGAASQVRLRAHGEVSLTRGNIFLPKIKHKIRPVILDDSFYDALGQLTAANRDFSLAGLKKHWNLAPNDLRWVAMAIPIVLGLIWYSSSGGEVLEPETVASNGTASVREGARGGLVRGPAGKLQAGSKEQAAEAQVAEAQTGEGQAGEAQPASEPGVLGRIFGDDSMLEVKRSIQKRAAVELSDDFRQGLGDWSGVGDWASGWSYDRAGFLRPRQIAFYTPSLELSDYRFEFLGQIERKALSWVFRAADARNYYVNRLEIVEPGPLPYVVLVRYAVIGGKAGPRTVTRLPMQVQMDTLYRIRVDVQGKNFVTTVQGQVVDVFSDERISRGGVGFFAGPGEDVRLRWVEVSHQYDFLGRLCAFLVPYNVSK